MGSKFVCNTCHSITEPPPEVVYVPKRDKHYRDLIEAQAKLLAGHWSDLTSYVYEIDLRYKYNHTITCPICGTETRIWKESDEGVLIKGAEIELSNKVMVE